VTGFQCGSGQVWTDSSDPVRTCNDIQLVASGSWNPSTAETNVPGCHCTNGTYLDHTGTDCVTADKCSCYDKESDTLVSPGRTLRRNCSIW